MLNSLFLYFVKRKFCGAFPDHHIGPCRSGEGILPQVPGIWGCFFYNYFSFIESLKFNYYLFSIYCKIEFH